MTNNIIDAALKIGANNIIRALLKNKDTKESFKITVKLMHNKDRLQTKTIADSLVKKLYAYKIKRSEVIYISTAAYMCAVSFAILSHRERKAGEVSRALFALNRSNYYLGVLHSYSSETFMPSPEAKKAIQIIKDIADGGSKGGKSRDDKRGPPRQEAARLLSELKPKDGWNTYQQAATDIAKHVGKFIEKYELNHPGTDLEIGTSEDTLVPTIIRWITKVDVVTKAFESNASQKALKRIKNKKLKKHEDAPLPPSDEP
ncbi:hypothetical protein [uncultured Zoogloea sp.]|uniref:hypothetical protein n=1 Tax=uncultured Zoogloea sp. TaxID=160237 RepID=UPI002612CFCB|nr:hypothetical protein [uncultured Zoogloea sp.]